MRRSTACSSIASLFAVAAFLCLAPPALASYGAREGGRPITSSLRIYGAYLPDRLEWDDAHWGFGFAARGIVNSRWGIDFGAARFASSERSVVPVTVGLAFGPESETGLRPWVEFGIGAYRLESEGLVSRINPALSSGSTYSYVRTRRPPPTHRYDIGGYFGVGFDVPLSGRVNVGTGVRMHGWSGNPHPDGLVAIQSGLSYGF